MKAIQILLSVILAAILNTTVFAEDSNNKEVYSFTSKSGTPVFTDKKPRKSHKTRSIKSSTPKNSNSRSINTTYNTTNIVQINNNKTIIINKYSSKKNRRKKTRSKKSRCKSYQSKLDKVMDKMKAGYRPSEYNRLEKKRLKYRSLVFNNC